MRHSTLATFTAILLLGTASVPSLAEGTPAQQSAQPAPETSSNPSARQPAPDENQKSSGTNDQSGPSAARPTPDQNSQGNQATHSVSGRGGKEEPSSHIPTQDTAALIDGRLNVPGAPADSQTIPAKFSQRNDAIDHLPIMAMPALGLSDAQKKAIAQSVKDGGVPLQATTAKVAEELPWQVTVHDLGVSSQDPALSRMKYVRAQDRILLVNGPNRIVIGEIKN